MITPVSPALFIALVPDGLSQLLSFGLHQQFVKRFLHAATNQFLKLPFDYFLIKLYTLFRHDLFSPFRVV